MTDRDDRAVARDQAARTMRALEPDVQQAVEGALEDVAAGFARQLQAAIDPQILASLAALWAQNLTPILTALQAVYQRAWATTGRRFTPDPPTAVQSQVDDYLRTARRRLTLVGDDLWQAARRELADGVAAGESSPQLRRRLRQVFAADGTQLGESRAERIARSEVVSAWNRASLNSVQALPDAQRPRYKTWLATLDRRTRDSHWQVDGAVVLLDGQFTVGGEPMDGPGDPDASAAQTVNCRCALTYGDTAERPDDEGRQFLSDEEIRDLDRQRPDRGQDADLAAANLTTNSAAGRGPGAPNREPHQPMTQMEAVVATVAAGGHWTAADVALKADVPLPAVRTYLARAVETGRLQRVERGVYAAAGAEQPWHTPHPTALAFEGTETGDGRIFAPGALYWEGESWPLQYADEMLPGHEGAELAGAISELARSGGRLAGRGTLYADTEPGAQVHSLLERAAPVGVSVDLDDMSLEVRAGGDEEQGEPVEVLVASASVLLTAEGWRITTGQAPDLVAAGLTAAAGDSDDTASREVIYSEEAGDVVMRVTRARLRGATLVVLPAFSEARIVLGEGPLHDEGEDTDGEMVAAVTGDVDLPILEDRDRQWDGPAAASRVLEWAQQGDPGDEELAARLSRAFLYRDDTANPATLSAYSLGVADVVDGELRIIPRGVFATAGGRGVDALADVSEEDRDRLRARICGLYDRLAEALDDDELVCPWRRDDDTASDLEAAAGGSGMVALIPADPEGLAVEGGDPAGELHVTLAFLGDAAELTDEAVQVARETAARVADRFGQVDARVAGVGTLGAEDPPATVFLLNGRDMDELREAVWADLGDFGWEAFAEQHQPWIPHLTVGYGVPQESVTVPEGIRFDRVRLAVGGDTVDFPLTAATETRHDHDQHEDEMSEIEASAWHELQQLPPLPAAWFAEPTRQELPTDGGPVHYNSGRIWGWVAQRGVPHESLGVEAPIDDVDLSTFLRSTRQLDDGTTVKVGAFTMNVGHHRDSAECETDVCAFDNTRTVAGIVTVGTNRRGMWFAGAAAPWLSEWDREVFTACAPSGHWRQERWGGRWSLRAVLAVPYPGYPTRLAASAVVERANSTLAALPTQATGGDMGPFQVEVQPVINWDAATTDEGGRRSLQALASAVVDEMERREAARVEIQALQAQMAEVERDMLTAKIEGDQ